MSIVLLVKYLFNIVKILKFFKRIADQKSDMVELNKSWISSKPIMKN